MGYVLAYSPCLTCNQVFAYNPQRVPSSDVFTGRREPICRSCFEQINRKRREWGLKPFPLKPDAYEPLPEAELP
jgi:hypothetical protein